MSITDRRGVSVDATDTIIAGSPNPGLAIKAPCRAATTANITLSGLQTIDGTVLIAKDRVLVWQQTDQKTNGLYNVSTGAWTRTIDARSNDQWANGMMVEVNSGTLYARNVFQLQTADPVVLGTSLIVFMPASPVPTSRLVNTTAPLAGGGALTADLTLSLTIGATFATVGGALQTVAATGDVTWSANSFITAIASHAVSNAKFRQGVARSLVGVTGNATADVADIQGTANQIPVVNNAGTALAFTTVSGDVTNVSGAFTIGANAITAAKLATGALDPNALIGLQLNASVGSNLLTIAVKNNAGVDATAAAPVVVGFRDVTVANGDPTFVTITSALSISTNAVGATLGTANNVPFRLWVLLFNNGGTPVLALWQSVTGGATPTAIAPLDESTLQSTTAISGAATSAGVFYTPNGTTLASKAFRILGYVDYSSGLGTAGTYASVPSRMQLFGPGIRKPGDVIQSLYVTTLTATTTTSSTYQGTNATASISPTTAPNLVRARTGGPASTANGANANVFVAMFRGSTELASTYQAVSSAVLSVGHLALEVLDAPGTTSSTTYTAKVKSQDNVTSVTFPRVISGEGGAMMAVDEIMA